MKCGDERITRTIFPEYSNRVILFVSLQLPGGMVLEAPHNDQFHEIILPSLNESDPSSTRTALSATPKSSISIPACIIGCSLLALPHFIFLRCTKKNMPDKNAPLTIQTPMNTHVIKEACTEKAIGILTAVPMLSPEASLGRLVTRRLPE